MKSFLIAVTASLCLVGSSQAQDDKDKDAKRVTRAKAVYERAKVDFAAAFDTAQKKVPDGKPLIARIELKDDIARYGFYFLDGPKVQEVEVDVKTGEIIKFKEPKEAEKKKKIADAIKIVKDSKVSFKEAMDVAGKRVKGGKIFEVELQYDGDRPIVEVEYWVENRIVRVGIDAKDASAVTVK